MTSEGKTLLASLFLHLILIGGAVLFFAIPLKPQAQILIDFTMEQGRHAEQREIKGTSGASQQRVTPLLSTPQKMVPTSAAPELPFVPAQPVNAIAVAPSLITGTAAPASAATPTAGVPTAEPGNSGNAGQSATSDTGEKNPGVGNGLHGDTVESRHKQYLKEHFAYIRDVIAGNLRYPGKARKMGWSGKLAIEFVILESGTVEKIRIAKSSGIPLLDSDAEETVRRSAPFPKPPVSARLVIPLEYVLK